MVHGAARCHIRHQWDQPPLEGTVKVTICYLKQQQFSASQSDPSIIVPGSPRATLLAQDMGAGVYTG